jgi:hypothetical protein
LVLVLVLVSLKVLVRVDFLQFRFSQFSHEQLQQIEKQAMQCHSYIQLQHKECLLAEAQLKEGKGNLHALAHIANSPVWHCGEFRC